MKKTLFTIITIIIATAGFAQDITTSLAYDSTRNFLGKEVYQYKGQELFLKGLAKADRNFGYGGFILNYKEDDDVLNEAKNIYKANDNYNSSYDELTGRYFIVQDIIAHPKAKQNSNEYGDIFYLKLREKSSSDEVYYKYNAGLADSFPFIVTGFYLKEKEKQIGKEYVVSDEILKMSRNLNTGDALKFTTGQTWECIDLTMDNTNNELSLVLEARGGLKTAIPYSSLYSSDGMRKVFTSDEALALTKKYNSNNFRRILQHKLRVGMTKEMTQLAWGKPIDVKKTSKNSEQWIYPMGKLTFRGNAISVIN